MSLLRFSFYEFRLRIDCNVQFPRYEPNSNTQLRCNEPSQNKITVGSNYNVTKVLKKCFLNQNYTTSPDRLVAESSPPELISFMFISNSDVRSLFSIGDITGSLLSSSL